MCFVFPVRVAIFVHFGRFQPPCLDARSIHPGLKANLKRSGSPGCPNEAGSRIRIVIFYAFVSSVYHYILPAAKELYSLKFDILSHLW